MPAITSGVATLAVATIFYIYRGYAYSLLQRQRILRERVAYML